MLLELLCCVVALCCLRVWWMRWRYDLHKIPSPPCWPVIGHTLDFTSGKASTQLAIYVGEKLRSLCYPKLMRLQVSGSNMIVVTDVQYVYSVVLGKASKFNKPPSFRKLLYPMMGNDVNSNLMAMTLELTPYVKAMRKLFATAFKSSQLKKSMPKMNSLMQKMIDIIESKRQQGPIDFQKLCTQFTLDTIGLVAMDTNLGGLDGSRQIYGKIIEAGYVARAIIAKPFHELYCKLFPKSKIAQEEKKIIDDLTAEWDALARELQEKDDPPEGDTPLWYAYKTLINPMTNAPMPFNTFLGEMAGTIIGGTDSTGHQLGWILAMLASHPHIADKLLEEFRDHDLYGPDARELKFEDLGELKYLSAVIKEGMRIAAVINVTITREMQEDMTVLGYRIPKGTVIIAPSNRSLMSEAVWGDPEVVRPERWMTDEDMSNKFFRIFSSGPRDCSGQKLAMLEIRFAIVKLLIKYQLSMDISFNELLSNVVDGLLIEAKDGIWLKATPRKE